MNACSFCGLPVDGDATICQPCADNARAEIAAMHDAAPYTGDVCKECGALLTVSDRQSSSPGSCRECRRKEFLEWIKTRTQCFVMPVEAVESPSADRAET